jgi:nucleotide-binding universal stress UspA family protein
MTAPDTCPVVVAYDGSPEAQAAVREAATLFGDRRMLVVTVWERGLAAAAFAGTAAGETGMSYQPPDPAVAAEIDDLELRRALDVAEAGARVARELGATADAVPVPELVDVAETLSSIAEEHDACVVVVGSRGLGAVKRHLLGSTSQRLLHHTHRPVLVVRVAD